MRFPSGWKIYILIIIPESTPRAIKMHVVGGEYEDLHIK